MKKTDLTYLEQLANGSNTFMAEMIQLFLQQTPEEIRRMKKSMAEKDWKTLGGVLHKIKPSITFVGLKDIEDVVKTAEDFAFRESNLERLPEMIQTIERSCLEAMAELNAELKRFS